MWGYSISHVTSIPPELTEALASFTVRVISALGWALRGRYHHSGHCNELHIYEGDCISAYLQVGKGKGSKNRFGNFSSQRCLNLITPFFVTAVASGTETGQSLEQLVEFCICFWLELLKFRGFFDFGHSSSSLLVITEGKSCFLWVPTQKMSTIAQIFCLSILYKFRITKTHSI